MPNKELKIKCLKECEKHWQWLADTGSKNKLEYPDYEYSCVTCWLCEYVNKIDPYYKLHKMYLRSGCYGRCVLCPLANKWGDEGQEFCGTEGSYFHKWGYGDICVSANPNEEQRKEAAQKIADACRQEIARLEEEDA